MVKYDPDRSPKLVLIGHGMGGLLAKSLAVDSGTTLWDTICRVPAGSLRADEAVRCSFEGTLILEPSSSVGLIVFMGTPQHGSEEADGLLGRISAGLLHLPQEYMNLTREVGLRDFDQLQPGIRSRFTSERMTSVASLSPHDPLMHAYGKLPIVAGVPSYSRMGNITKDSHGRPSDGYVTVDSAELPGSVADYVLPIGHRPFDRRRLSMWSIESCATTPRPCPTRRSPAWTPAARNRRPNRCVPRRRPPHRAMPSCRRRYLGRRRR